MFLVQIKLQYYRLHVRSDQTTNQRSSTNKTGLTQTSFHFVRGKKKEVKKPMCTQRWMNDRSSSLAARFLNLFKFYADKCDMFFFICYSSLCRFGKPFELFTACWMRYTQIVNWSELTISVSGPCIGLCTHSERVDPFFFCRLRYSFFGFSVLCSPYDIHPCPSDFTLRMIVFGGVKWIEEKIELE